MSNESKIEKLKAGDRVRIIKPDSPKGDHRYGWVPEMDVFDGREAHVTELLDTPDDEDIPAYDLDIDGGEFGWLHSFLQKAGDTE